MSEKIDFSKVKLVTPPKAPEPPYIQKAGVNLVKFLLWMISIFVVISLGILGVSEWRNAKLIKAASEEVFKYTVEKDKEPSFELKIKAIEQFLDKVKVQRSEFREYWFKINQMVLLNVLLPVLTAILGYVFGTKQAE